ncbi:MAG: tRNA lysidine(34) synthetase TilS [bacterium]|nr:tRNA lysidine(34) synthetase TilS [bacterium]
MKDITSIVKEKIYKTILQNSLISPGDKVIIGLSGGADSMCLAHVLCSLSERLMFEVAAAHMNHNIRGESAESDAEAAKRFSERLGIKFYYRSADVVGYSKQHSISEELSGRELRYSFFEDLQKKYGFNKTATAHNKNDNAETLLMNFIRGSSVSGLCGIPVKRSTIIRPLIDVTRSEIEAYCCENKLPYVTDSTNLKDIYTRNKIRLKLIPELQNEFNPNFINTVTANARIINEENEYINTEAKKVYEKFKTQSSVTELNKLHNALKRRVIMMMLTDKYGSAADISSAAVEDISDLCMKNQTGKRVNIPKGYIALTEYGRLTIKKAKQAENFLYKLNVGEEVYIPQLNSYIKAEICTKKQKDKCIYISCNEADELYVRSRRNGDVFFPEGMHGRKKLKNFFIDKKIPAESRSLIPIITVGEEIAAVSDIRTDRRYIFGKNKINLKIIIK